jgi:hypothetical protein
MKPNEQPVSLHIITLNAFNILMVQCVLYSMGCYKISDIVIGFICCLLIGWICVPRGYTRKWVGFPYFFGIEKKSSCSPEYFQSVLEEESKWSLFPSVWALWIFCLNYFIFNHEPLFNQPMLIPLAYQVRRYFQVQLENKSIALLTENA